MISVSQARQYYVDSDSAHGFDHVLRVWRLAERIGRTEGADMRILCAAALLHDVARPDEMRTGVDHAVAGAQRARQILAGHCSEEIEAVCAAIREHRYRGDRGPSTIEARVLYDADKLDAIGAIGVARAYAVAGTHGQHLWAEVAEDYAQRPPNGTRDDMGSAEHTPVHEFRFKLVGLAERMHTDSGRRLARKRHAYMISYFERLEREVQGEV